MRWVAWPAVTLLAALATAVALSLTHGSSDPHAASQPSAFGWLRPAAIPPGWRQATASSGVALAYPRGWRRIHSDAGTVSAAPAGSDGVFRGYLNVTPQSGGETLDNWRRFRPEHVGEEGAHDVRLAAAATDLRFRAGHGSCVIDSYSTNRARFREIACIVTGRSTTVIVAAAPESAWSAAAPALERAVASFAT